MSKEIERKWLFRGNTYDVLSTVKGYDSVVIKDYYFNEYTRLRYTYHHNLSEPVCTMCTKSKGTIERDEYEYTLSDVPNEAALLMRIRPLQKVRYKVFYKGRHFEVNIFKSLPLITVEIELYRKDEYLEVPDWCGEEITGDRNFYGYELWESIQNVS